MEEACAACWPGPIASLLSEGASIACDNSAEMSDLCFASKRKCMWESVQGSEERFTFANASCSSAAQRDVPNLTLGL